jgi:hypothetical protein
MRYRLCAALLTLLLAPPALDAAHAAEPAPTAATANEDAAVVSAPAPLDLGSLLTTDVYVLQAPSPLRVDVAQAVQDASLRAQRVRSALRRNQALVGAAALVAGLLVAPSRNEWNPIDEGWIGLGGAAVGAVLLLDSAFGPHWGPPER